MATKKQKEYYEKLKDPRWQKVRLEIFERDNWTCQICLDDDKTLTVHHRYYIPDVDPWEYPLIALVTLCEYCHEKEREYMPISEKTLMHELKIKFFSDDIFNLAIGIHHMELLNNSSILSNAYLWALKTPEIQEEIVRRYIDTVDMVGRKT